MHFHGSSVCNSLETRLWWSTIKASLQNDEVDFAAAQYTQTPLCSDGRLTDAERKKEQTCTVLNSNSRRCGNVSNWTACNWNSNDPQPLKIQLVFSASLCRCYPSWVPEHHLAFCLLKKRVSFDDQSRSHQELGPQRKQPNVGALSFCDTV